MRPVWEHKRTPWPSLVCALTPAVAARQACPPGPWTVGLAESAARLGHQGAGLAFCTLSCFQDSGMISNGILNKEQSAW